MYLFKIIKEYLRRIVRNYKIYAITILGMSIAIIASFHIYFFVAKEYSVDAFHTKKEDIYRVISFFGNQNSGFPNTPFPLGDAAKKDIPEIQDFARKGQAQFSLNIRGNESKLNFEVVDPSFFDIFSFKLSAGTIANFKAKKNAVIISEKQAALLFPDENPIGKTIQISQENDFTKEVKNYILEVTGVLNNITEASTIQGEFFINIWFIDRESESKNWGYYAYNLYLYTPNLKNVTNLEEKLVDVLVGGVNKEYRSKENSKIVAQRFDKIYLESEHIDSMDKKGAKQTVFILSLVVCLILFLAGTNYLIMNLGLNLNRVSEFKVKRYLGASKGKVFIQLCVESTLNVLLCFLITLFSYPFFETLFSTALDYNYPFSYVLDFKILYSFLGMLLLIAFLISVIQFGLLYKPLFFNQQSSTTYRGKIKSLVGIQLLLFIIIISSSLLINKQLNFLQKKELGFTPDKVISAITFTNNMELISILKSKSYVKNVTQGERLFREKSFLRKTKVIKTNLELQSVTVMGDANYLEVHNMELLQGRQLNPDILPTNFKEINDPKRTEKIQNIEVLVNEEYVKQANLKNPIGEFIDTGMNNKDAIIVGVFKDTYFRPLYYAVQPMIIGFDFNGFPGSIQISFHENNRKELVELLTNYYKDKGYDSATINLGFIKEFNYQEVYKKEIQLKNLIQIFLVIVLIIAVLGLIAISLFITQNRTKEIGIRKINGATTLEILKMLNKSFVFWVGIAFVFAVPISYIIMQKWLQNFAFKTALSWWVFALSGLLVLLISLLAVSWQTYKAATQNPVKALRDD